MTGRHVFNFIGGDDLTTMGACWFVSYCYYENIDKNHRNWDYVSTASSRSSVYRRTRSLHRYWLQQVLLMDIGNLNKNSLHLSGGDVKKMAEKLLQIIK